MSYIGNLPTNVAFVTDTFSGNGSTVAFTTSVAPASTSSILVAVTGVLQDPSTYSVSGTTLTFSAAPPSGTGNISVRYLGIPASGVTTTAYRTVTEFTATAGQTTFSVPSYTAGYIDVYRNGARLGAADFTATNGTTVVLTNACNLNDLVVTESFYVSSVLNAIPNTAAAVQQTNLAVGVGGTGPAFNARNLASTTMSASNTMTKLEAASEDFDTASCYNTSTYRFTPNVAGYYFVTGTGRGNTSTTAANNLSEVAVYKNGSQVSYGSLQYSLSVTNIQSNTSVFLYMNGTTDYIELYGRVVGTSTLTIDQVQFGAFLARAA